MKKILEKKQKGITLIALVITIIVLIILAGVAISLTLGKNGLLNKAKYAREEYRLSQAREKLELEIIDVQTKIMEEQSRVAILEDLKDLINISKYEIILHYEPIATTEVIQQKATYAEIVEIEGKIKFIVDNKLVIKEVTIENIENLEVVINNVEIKIGTSYVDIAVNAESKTEKELTYKYIVDGEEVKATTENKYIIENLEPESTHTIKIIVTDGKQEISQTKTIVTEKRIYLYSNGEEYTDITGGWVKAFSTYSGTGEKKDNYLYCYSPINQNVFSTYYFKTTNKIDLEEYKSLCSEVSVTVHSNGSGGHFAKFGTWNGNDYQYYGSMVREPDSSNYKRLDSGENQKISIDISNLKEKSCITAGITSGGANDSISANIYKVWLEK